MENIAGDEPPGDLMSRLVRRAGSLRSPQAMAAALREAELRQAEMLVLSACERASEGGDAQQIAFWHEVRSLVLPGESAPGEGALGQGAVQKAKVQRANTRSLKG